MFKVGDKVKIVNCSYNGYIKWIIDGFGYNLYAVILDNKFWPNLLYSFKEEEMELL